MISQETIRKIKQCGIVDIASQYTNVTKISSNLYSGKCPHPDHNDSTASFRIFINPDNSQSFACMGCHCGQKDEKTNYGSDNIAFMRWLSDNSSSKKKMSFMDSLKFLANFYGIPLEKDRFHDIYVKNWNEANVYANSHTKESLNYLFSRNLDMADIVRWCIGFNGKRITFPVFDKNDNIIAFSGRIIDESSIEPKYRNSYNNDWFHKKEVFYGMNMLENNNNNKIYITEGPFDVVLSYKYGLRNVVCTLGCSLSESHANIIKKHGLQPVLCYDNDKAGNKGIEKAYKILSSNGIGNIEIIKMPAGMDLADLSLSYKSNLMNYIKSNTISYIKHKLDDILNDMDNTIAKETTKADKSVKELLKTITDISEFEIFNSYSKKRLKLWG